MRDQLRKPLADVSLLCPCKLILNICILTYRPSIPSTPPPSNRSGSNCRAVERPSRRPKIQLFLTRYVKEYFYWGLIVKAYLWLGNRAGQSRIDTQCKEWRSTQNPETNVRPSKRGHMREPKMRFLLQWGMLANAICTTTILMQVF